MSLEESLVAHLNHQSITTLVQDRIYPLVRDQGGTLPAIVYTVVGVDDQVNLDGIDASLRAARVQVDCWAESFDAAVALALAVRDRINTPRTVGSPDAPQLRGAPAPGSQFDEYEQDTKLFRRSIDFNLWYRET